MLKYIPGFILIMHGILIFNGYKFTRFNNDISSAILSIVIGIIFTVLIMLKPLIEKRTKENRKYKDNLKIKKNNNNISFKNKETIDDIHNSSKKTSHKYKIMLCKIINVLFLILLLLFGFDMLPYPNLMILFMFIIVLCQFNSEATQRYFEELNEKLHEKEK